MCLAFGVSGCENSGYSLRDEEWARVRNASGFGVVAANHERAVVYARDRPVVIEPAEGFCVSEESIETSSRSVFVLIGDCVLSNPDVADGAINGRLNLPRGLPGIVTVSISGDSGYTRDGAGAGSLEDLGEFLETREGRAMLGRGGAGGSVRVRDQRTIGNALYVLVEDVDADIVPILSPKFWRSFVDLNDRLTVVTISGFRDSPIDDDEMLRYLANQVKTLSRANRTPFNIPETRIAVAAPKEPAKGPVQQLTDLKPDALVVSAETVVEDPFWPVPRKRPDQSLADISDPDTQLSASEAIPVPRPDVKNLPTDTVVAEQAGVSEVGETNAAVDDAVADADTAATRYAPRNAPPAPRRPKRG